MFNVKLIKLTDYDTGDDFYINLNHLVSVEPSGFQTKIFLLDDIYYIVDMEFDKFVDYLVELSGLQKGGESE